MAKKLINPKDIISMKKAPLSTVPCGVLFEIGLGMLEGARKYGRHNYRSIGVTATEYYNASMRHIMLWWEGEDVDPDSGLNHITKALSDLTVLRDSMLMDNWIDDRPLRNPINIKKINAKATDIVEKYPDCVEPFLQCNIKKKHISAAQALTDIIKAYGLKVKDAVSLLYSKRK